MSRFEVCSAVNTIANKARAAKLNLPAFSTLTSSQDRSRLKRMGDFFSILPKLAAFSLLLQPQISQAEKQSQSNIPDKSLALALKVSTLDAEFSTLQMPATEVRRARPVVEFDPNQIIPSTKVDIRDRSFDWDRLPGADSVVKAKSGCMTSYLFLEWQKWVTANPKSTVLEAAVAARALIHNVFGDYHTATSKHFAEMRSLQRQIIVEYKQFTKDYPADVLSAAKLIMLFGERIKVTNPAYYAAQVKLLKWNGQSKKVLDGKLSKGSKEFVLAAAKKALNAEKQHLSRYNLAEKKLKQLRDSIPDLHETKPVDPEDVGCGNLVCRHFAVLGHAMLESIGVESELCLGEMLINDGSPEKHLWVFLPKQQVCVEFTASNSKYTLYSLVQRWDSNEGVNEPFAFRVSSSMGYRFEFLASVESSNMDWLRVPRIEDPAPEVVALDTIFAPTIKRLSQAPETETILKALPASNK